MKNETQTPQHRWLHKLLGEWRYETEAQSGPGEPPSKASGTERVRALGDLWVLCEGEGQMPGGEPATTLMTLGYDPQRQRFTGSWVGSMMTHLWIYDGALDAAETVLSLECDGPDWNMPGKTARYRDAIEWKSADHRVLTASVRDSGGRWSAPFMTAHYRRIA